MDDGIFFNCNIYLAAKVEVDKIINQTRDGLGTQTFHVS
jgi:3-deoxy-D-manno-octulosonate 8-phosphate phosphatase KdsC-like HAD superfamily phosphatase